MLTPRYSALGQIDYSTSLADYTLRGHLDVAWDSGSFGSSTPNVVGIPNPRSQPGIIFNTRVSVGDIALGNSGGEFTVSFWVRNLFNEQHLVARSYSAGAGYYGNFNDPRSFGAQGTVKF